MSIYKRYGFAWITLGLFLFSLVGHWAFGWYEYLQNQIAHHQEARFAEYFVWMMRGTLENWQSEFLQLAWQVIGLTYFLYIGSPQSKEEDDRLEEKLDAILRAVEPERAQRLIDQLDERFPGRAVAPRL